MIGEYIEPTDRLTDRSSAGRGSISDKTDTPSLVPSRIIEIIREVPHKA